MGQCWTNICGCKSENSTDKSCKVLLSGRNVHLIATLQKWEEKISESSRDDKIVVANFSAAWCSPCRLIAPQYCDLADKYSSMIFLTVDVDELPEFSTSWDIKATPTFFFLKDGRQIDMLVGASKVELQKKIATIAESTNRNK